MKYFGTDGVRGVANQELTPELAFKLGRCGGYVLSKLATDEVPQVLVARDTRMSGQLLEYALVAGLMSVGIEVMQLGVLPTPGVAYLTRAQEAVAGVMISASHNPAQDNGIKFFAGNGFKLSDEMEEEIEALLDQPVDNLPRPSAEGLGTVEEYLEGALKYAQFLRSSIADDLSGLHVCLDGANGATTAVLTRIFADLNTDFDLLGDKPNGLNINAGVGSTHPEKLAEYVVETGADVGLAFDGDGDRCIAIDEKGNIIDGDKIMLICGRYLKDYGRLKEDTIVTTVMSNLGMFKAADELGLHLEKTQVGDRYVSEKMREGGYNLGGEQSGHIIFMDLNTTGDGLLTGIQLLNVMKQTGKKLSELAEVMEVFPQTLINVPVKDKAHVMDIKEVAEVIQQTEKEMAGEGRILVRPSGTEPLVRVMVEAKTHEDCDRYAQAIAEVIREKA